MMYIAGLVWVVVGLLVSIRMWTKSYNLELGDVPLILFYGCVAGPFSGLIWLYTSWLTNTYNPTVHKVLMKRRN